MSPVALAPELGCGRQPLFIYRIPRSTLSYTKVRSFGAEKPGPSPLVTFANRDRRNSWTRGVSSFSWRHMPLVALKPPAPATTCRGSPRICCDRRRARRRPAAERKRPAQPLLGPAAAGRAAAQRVERTEPAQSGASRERPRPPRRRRPRPTVVANQRGAVQRGQVLPGSRQQRLVAWAARPFETARGAVRDLSRRHGALYHP